MSAHVQSWIHRVRTDHMLSLYECELSTSRHFEAGVLLWPWLHRQPVLCQSGIVHRLCQTGIVHIRHHDMRLEDRL